VKKDVFSSNIYNKKIITTTTVTFATLFIMSALVLTSTVYLNSAFAQIGLAPVIAFQKVLPTYIIDIPAGAVSANKSTHFVPEKVSIPFGTTIAWFNDDPGQVHTVTSGLPNSPNAGKLFNSGVMPEGSFYQYTFDIVGDYRYHCILHPYMAGTVHVGGAYEIGHYFKMTSGANHVLDNTGVSKLTINKTQFDRSLFDFKPLNIAIDSTTPVVYNLKISNNNSTLFSNNFQVLGGNNLQVELVLNNVNGFNVYGPDVTDPITGAYHVEGNFADGNYKITVQLVSIGTEQQTNNITDEFGLRIAS
jgi:plastocyanin